jgi:endonuclease-3
MKASEKQTVCKKLVTALKKRYKQPLAKNDRPVLELLLYAICLENVSEEEADASLERLMDGFHDYNEMRVSSLSEIEPAFQRVDQPEYRALRVRTVLQDIFENLYSFDFEGIRKKTLEAASKQLGKLRYLSDFVRNFTLQAALGAHVVPLDERMRNAVVWLGLVSPTASEAEAAEELKSVLRKNDAPLFCRLLRCLATDPEFVKTFENAMRKPPEEGFDPATAVDRLDELLKSGGKSRKAKTSRKSSGGDSSARKKAAKSSSKSDGAAKKKTKTKKRSVASR